MLRQKGDWMKAVYEERNGDVAVFVADDEAKVYNLAVSKLPDGVQIGEVFEVAVAADGALELLERLPDERARRLEANRLKREELLRRKK